MSSPILFKNREDAGQHLAQALLDYQNQDDVIVLALPRGGVPVGYEIAQKLHCPLDIMLVRKLGLPSFPELAFGAIATGGIKILNKDVLRYYPISDKSQSNVEQQETMELMRREGLYRTGLPALDLNHKTVILVDDGIATGATLKAAIAAVKQRQPKHLVVAVPVASAKSAKELKTLSDEFICLLRPNDFNAVGEFYQQFSQVEDETVIGLLQPNSQ